MKKLLLSFVILNSIQAAPNIKIASFFINSISGDLNCKGIISDKIVPYNCQINFDKELNKKVNNIYTYIDDGNDNNVYLRIDLDKKNKNNPFNEVNQEYISLDVGTNQNYNYDYYIQYSCDDFNQIGCKYHIAFIDPEEFGKDQILEGWFGVKYKKLCQHLKDKKNIMCDENDPSRQNEVFFKLNDAVIYFNNIKAYNQDISSTGGYFNADDGRRDFKLRYYSSYESIKNKGVIIKHRPITIRPEAHNIQSRVCDVFSFRFADCVLDSSKTSPETIYKNGTSNGYYLSAYKYKVLDSKGNEYLFDFDNNKITYNYPADIRKHFINKGSFGFGDYFAYIPFVSDGEILAKEDHIKKYLEELGYNASDSCIDNDDILTNNKIKANTRDLNNDFKLYCQTPANFNTMKDNHNQELVLNENINKDALSNVAFIGNKEYAYRFSPKILITSIHDDTYLLKKFKSDLNVEVEFSLDRKIDTKYFKILANKQNKLSNGTKINPIYAKNALIASVNIEQAIANKVKINFTLSKDELNKAYDNALKELYKAGKNVKEMITSKEDRQEVSMGKYSSIKVSNKIRKLGSAAYNAYEIPLDIYYENTLVDIFKITKVDIKISGVDTNLSLSKDLNVSFIRTTPKFKDIKVNNSDYAIVDSDDVMLRYKDIVTKDFTYIKDDNDKFDFSTLIECNTVNDIIKPCFRINKNYYPGLSDGTRFMSDYGLQINKCSDTKNNICTYTNIDKDVVGVEFRLHSNSDTSYVKDGINCVGGAFDCNSYFSIEFNKQ